MARVLAVLYGILCYVLFFGTFLYAVAFVGNYQIDGIVPKTIDSGAAGPLVPSIVIDLVLMGIFGLQHSIMARPGFKAAWTRVVPQSIERSTYVLFSNLALILLYWQWRPLTQAIWVAGNPVVHDVLVGVFFAGWVIVLLSSFMIDHFELFGLRQVFHHMRGHAPPSMAFRMVAFYRIVRHPIMLGFIIAFWATPAMTLGHLLFAAVTTLYILVALHFEERDLVAGLGQDYVQYRSRVRMIVPLPK
ncbi:MAG: isoprenylcysteine carboxylmethyltransferase family protein [Alphaproteobacteria bacterium]|nr:isoprenylcysteine carboxylmethyltransferase family protein [Alphaproteobacteria bacterium]